MLPVADEIRVADFVRHGLDNEGTLVQAMGDGETALEPMNDRSFDGVLPDLVFPGNSDRAANQPEG